nr:integrase, catalytic region, zinc finger, CCHC-type, peptidase aspartic, catalytic [Tanacetum cinerariifolium]
KFVREFKSLAKEDDESLTKHKALELEIKRLLRAAVSQDIISVVQNNSVGETSNLQTGLERTKERFENRIIKKENEYAKLWNDWCKKCEECKFDKISYDKAYNDMQQKIEWLQAQSGDLKGKISDQKDTTRGTSANTKFAKQSLLRKLPKVGETHALSKPVTSNLIPTPQGSKVMKNDKVITLGMFRINPFETSKEEKHVTNKVRASIRTNLITVSKPPIITKKVVNSDSNGLSSTGVATLRPKGHSLGAIQRMIGNKKHMSSECNKVKLTTQNINVVCAMCKQCLSSVNHDVCFLNYVNGINSRGKKQKANVSINEKQKKQQPKVKKTNKAGFIERLATPKPSKSRSFLRWSPTRRMFDLKGKIIASSESESQSDCSKGDNACTSNPLEPTIKQFPSYTFSLVGKFCDSDLEVAFRRNACFVKNLEGVDLLLGNRIINLYTINLHDMAPICHMALATSTKSKDEAPEVIKTFPKRITIFLQSHVIIIRTDNGTEFKNQVPKKYFDSVGISHQVSFIQTLQQNGVVERGNRTLVEAARTMLIFSRASLFLWAEAIATACFTLNRSMIHQRFNKTPYELINERKPDIFFLHVSGALCYPRNDREDIGKRGAKGDIGFFIGYSADSYAFRVYNCRTKKIMETMNVSFDELSATAFEQRS